MTRRGLLILALAVGLGVGGALAARGVGIRPVQIQSGSMEPTIKGGDWIVVRDLDGDAGYEVKRGDIVMFPFVGGSRNAIKRVLAIGGDHVTIRSHSATVNGKTKRIAGAPGLNSARTRTEVVPRGSVFLLGDNAASSIDSRAFGAVPARELVARQLANLGTSGAAILKAVAVTIALTLTLLAATAWTRRRRMR